MPDHLGMKLEWTSINRWILEGTGFQARWSACDFSPQKTSITSHQWGFRGILPSSHPPIPRRFHDAAALSDRCAGGPVASGAVEVQDAAAAATGSGLGCWLEVPKIWEKPGKTGESWEVWRIAGESMWKLGLNHIWIMLLSRSGVLAGPRGALIKVFIKHNLLERLDASKKVLATTWKSVFQVHKNCFCSIWLPVKALILLTTGHIAE